MSASLRPSRRRFLAGGALAVAGGASAGAAQETVSDPAGAFRAPGGRSVARPLAEKLGELVSVLDKGARGNGIDDDTASVMRAIADAPNGGTIWFPPGRAYRLNGVNGNGKRLLFLMEGAEILCAGPAAITRSDHGSKLTLQGGHWTGPGSALRWTARTTEQNPFELAVIGCEFETDDYALWLDGVRENVISHCGFRKNGIRRIRTVNSTILACIWDACDYAVNDGHTDGSAYSPFSAGLKIVGGTMIGCTHGVASRGSDHVELTGLMCDYNDNPLVFDGVERLSIIGGYYSSRSAAPVLLLHRAGGESIQDANLMGASFVQHFRHREIGDCIRIEQARYVNVVHCIVNNFNRFGIDYENCENLTIEGCRFAKHPDAGPGARNIHEARGSVNGSTNRILRNYFTNLQGRDAMLLEGVAQPSIGGNLGFATRAFGDGAVPAGADRQRVATNLPFDVAPQDVIVTPMSAEFRDKFVRIEPARDGAFAVVLEGPASGPALFHWRVEKFGAFL